MDKNKFYCTKKVFNLTLYLLIYVQKIYKSVVPIECNLVIHHQSVVVHTLQNWEIHIRKFSAYN